MEHYCDFDIFKLSLRLWLPVFPDETEMTESYYNSTMDQWCDAIVSPAAPSLSLFKSAMSCFSLVCQPSPDCRLSEAGFRGCASASTQHHMSPESSTTGSPRTSLSKEARKLFRVGSNSRDKFTMQVTSNMIKIFLDPVNPVSFPKGACPRYQVEQTNGRR